MDQTFSLARWWMLVTRHWVENQRRYGLALLAMGGLLAAWFGFLISIERYVTLDAFDQYAAYFCGLYFVGCLYASTIFAELNNKAQCITWLLIPASHLEKLLCAIFFCVLLFFLAYNLVFYLVDIPMVKLANYLVAEGHRVHPGTSIPIAPVPVMNMYNGDGLSPMENDFHTFLFGFFATQSAFILGSVYFIRLSFIKTTIAILLLILVTVVIITKGLQANMPDGWHLGGLMKWVRTKDMFSSYSEISLPSVTDKLLGSMIQFSAPLLFWLITYFRLKEKEVKG